MKVAQVSHAMAEWSLRIYWMALVCRIMQPDVPVLDNMLPPPTHSLDFVLMINLFFFEAGVCLFWHIFLHPALDVLFISLTVALAAMFWQRVR